MHPGQIILRESFFDVQSPTRITAAKSRAVVDTGRRSRRCGVDFEAGSTVDDIQV